MSISPEDQLILLSVKIHPSTAELDQMDALILEVRNREYLITTIIDRGIGPLLY